MGPELLGPAVVSPAPGHTTVQFCASPATPARPPSNEHQQRAWNHPSYPPPPPPPSLGYSPPPAARPRADERIYAPPPVPPPDSPNPRQSHGHAHSHPPPVHPPYRQSQSHHSHPHASPPQRPRRRDSTPAPHPAPAAVPEPTPEPVQYTPYSHPTTNPIDFNRLVHSYHMIMEAGKTLSAPRAADGAVDRMLREASYAAQVLEGASSGSSHTSQQQYQSQSRSLPPPTMVRGSPTAVQQQPPSTQHRLHRMHSASTVSSGSDNGSARAPSYSQPLPTRSPPGPGGSASMSAGTNPRAKDISPREGKAKIKISSPANGKGMLGPHGSESPALLSSPSKPKKSLEDSGHAPAAAGSSGSGTDRAHAQDNTHHGGTQKCLGCSATATPEWRRGPLGPRTLCNACGLVYAKLVKKRVREEARGASGAHTANPNGYGSSRTGQNREESESDEDDEEQSYDHTQMPGR
ncbi:hypothetical protein K438DRAFT_106170 [Mycena galopus ATCC 62051]|nr:hypothetical protein K438DRAFT_106170 [Mycena galopus ATCC 62051]